MSINRKLGDLANVLDDGTEGQVLSFNASGAIAASDIAAGASVYDSAELLPLTGLSAGDMAYVTGTNRFYISNGTGWYSVSLVNTNPSISSVQDSDGGTTPFTLATDGTATVITVTASDPEDVPLTYNYSVTSGSLTNGGGTTATVSQADNVFTVTPSTTEAYAGTFELTFTANDGINTGTSANSFTLSFITTITNSKYTALLATATDTSDNNTITDSSSNNHTPTLINPADALRQGTFSPYRSGGYSTYFSGLSNTYLNVSSSSGGVAIGSGDFTISFWVYSDDITTNNNYLLDYRPLNFNTGNHLVIYIQTDGTFRYKIAGTEVIVGNTVISSKQWAYFCVARDNGTTKMYVNGTLQTDTHSGTENLTNGSNRPVIGTGAYNISPFFKGYISDLRVVTSLDTTAYSVPTERLEAVTNTSLLTCHLPYISDGSTNDHSITVNAEISTEAFSPYDYEEYDTAVNGGSIQSTNSNDTSSGRTGLSFADHADFDLAGSDWTFEWWAYVPKSEGVYNHNFIQKGALGSIRPYTFNYRLESGQPGWEPRMFGSSDGSSQWQGYSGAAWQPWSTWTHIAFVRNGSTITRYINGKAYGTGTGDVYDNNEVLHVGGGYGDEQPHSYSDLRISKSAVYTAEFTPPTAPLSSTGSVLHLKGTDASIIDKSQSANLKLVGNTTGSTTQVKFASTKSMYFDGNGDYILGPTISDLNIGTGDFTVECWLYETTANTNRGIWDGRSSYISTDGFTFTRIGTDTFRVWSGSALITTGSFTIQNTWNHCALVRNSGTLTIYINGTSSGTPVSNSTNFSSSGTFIIGAGMHTNSPDPNAFITGYIQDFRISNHARYTANFTPPTASLEG